MTMSSNGASLFSSAVVDLICALECAAMDAGKALSIEVTERGRLRVSPRELLTDEYAARIREHRDALRLLVWCSDDGVQARRAVFARTVAAASNKPGLPALRYRDDVALERGRCVSCGDDTTAPVWCWRCQLAARLAVCGDVPVDWIPAGGLTATASVAA
jgi:hypothetical protein